MSKRNSGAERTSRGVCKFAIAIWLLASSVGELACAAEDTDPCVTQRNTLEINACSKRRLDEAEADLNSTYQAALAKLALPDGLGRGQNDIRKRLIEAQRHWVTFREKNCDAVLMLNADGTVRTYMYLSCKQQLAEERTKQLRLWFAQQ